MQHKWSLLAAGTLITTMLAGCAENAGERYHSESIRSNNDNDVSMYKNGNAALMNALHDRGPVNGPGIRQPNAYGMNKNIADRIASIEGMGNAYVLTVGDKAYVAITHESADAGRSDNIITAPNSRQPQPNRSTSGSGNPSHRSAGSADAHLAKTKNTYGLDGNLGTSGNYGMTGMYGTSGPSMYGTKASKGMNGIRSNDAVRRIDSLALDHPYGMTRSSKNIGKALTQFSSQMFSPSDRNGAPSVRPLAVARPMKADLKNRIEHEVKSMAAGVKTVYISDDPAFADRMKVYAGYMKIDPRLHAEFKRTD
ncbi:hypothetical protein [Paenibacillus sacheonensis]|uniref:Sporulation protein n=1 Tax=Paenibacillus sacheonensis TaxID=742054 RepID=A0A7X4YP08_9BACL|nr:hypothetical protein [Paenibacillus sacheonensis]MBM7564554.1 hypothetical protein [Paenibacillus sacheonensis]NBC69111.1 hypothetical protein [Paenibacillus sacheonensis]